LTTCENRLFEKILTNGQTGFGEEIRQVELIEFKFTNLIWSSVTCQNHRDSNKCSNIGFGEEIIHK